MRRRPAPRTAVRALAAASVLVGAGALLAPAGDSYTLTGWNLNVDSTHVRVFNNFADAETNDDTAPQSQFPGFDGAVRAIWKSAVEWGTSTHGTGDGDPTQPGDLGSGGSNFTPTFQGDALGVGGLNDNTHSAISSLGGGVLAITESGGNGWRIRYNDQYLWDDDSAGPAAGTIDLQSIATHEYGHALGLGHTTMSGCVMSPSSTGLLARDLCPDDQAGVQAIYGAATAGKPVITAVLVDAGGAVSIHGESFAVVGNEVWLTKASPGGAFPVKLTGVTATEGGTRIDVALPATAGPGDVLVKAPGTGLASLSNAWPIDGPGGVSCGAVPYGVGLGGANTAELFTSATPAVGSTFPLDLASFAVDGPALTLIASERADLPLLGGTVLIDPTKILATLTTTITGGSGVQPVPIPASPSLAGARVFAQAGQADGGAPFGVALSNGVEVVVCP